MVLKINEIFEGKNVKLFGLHEKISAPFKLVRKPNTEQESEDVYSDLLLRNATPETTTCRDITLYNSELDERYAGKEYHLLLDNDQYLGKPFDYYSVGSVNTSQSFLIRYKIMIEDCIVYLAKKFHSEGTYASSFVHEYDDFDSEIDYILDESREMGLVQFIEYDGLQQYVLPVFNLSSQTSDIIEFSIEDLAENLVGVELIRFEQEIH